MRKVSIADTPAVCIAAAAVLLAAASAAAQSSDPDSLVIPRLDTAPAFDGRVEDPAWEQALSLPLVQQRPTFGDEPEERTEILIGYTGEHVYAACRCYDSGTPSASSFRRNYFGGDSDMFALILDTFADSENGVAFVTAPTGLRSDAAVLQDAAVPADFNTFWEVEAYRDERGWFAEMRIPISSLSFDPGQEGAVMRLITWRWVARSYEAIIFPEIPPRWGAWSGWKVSQGQKVVFEEVAPRRLLKVTPYVLGGMGQQAVLRDDGAGYQTFRDPSYDAGVDVKYRLTGNLTLDLTVNTDFAQVEADDQEVNLTRFPLFFPEKRRFFQERASTFDFEFSDSDRVFYSRRIGLHDGQPVRILGGGRIVGRAGPWDIGILNMQTGREPGLGSQGDPLPSENYGVARVRRQILSPREAVKATLEGYYEALETENLGLTSFTRDVVLGLPDGSTVVGKEDVLAFLENTVERVVAIEVNQTVIEGDYACSMTDYHWTGGVSTPLAICFRITGAQIAEIRPYFDPRPLLQDQVYPMHIYIELWNACPAWTGLSQDERAAYVEKVAQNIQSLVERGIEPLYFALSDPDVPEGAGYDYMAVWKMPDYDSARELLRNVEQAGWHDYFEQVNARGASVPPEHVFGDMIRR